MNLALYASRQRIPGSIAVATVVVAALLLRTDGTDGFAGQSVESSATPPTEASSGASTPASPTLTPELLAQGNCLVETLESTVEVPATELLHDPAAGTLRHGTTTWPLDEVLSLRFNPEPPPGGRVASQGILVLLRSGEEYVARPTRGNEDAIVFRSAVIEPATGEEPLLRAPIDDVRAIVFPSQLPAGTSLVEFKRTLPGARHLPIVATEDSLVPAGSRTGDGGRASSLDASDSGDDSGDDSGNDKDILITTEGSRLLGLLTLIGEETVTFEADQLGELRLTFDKVRAVILADLIDDESPEEATGLRLEAHAVDGSFIRGRVKKLAASQLELESPSLGVVTVPLSRVRLIEVLGGRATYLSDLDPETVRIDNLFHGRAVQRDANVRGNPLSMRDRVYRKGLGMLAYTRLDYRLGGRYSRFKGLVGIDDEARRATLQSRLIDAGKAVFRVYVDDTVAFQKELSYRDPPASLDIPVSGAQVLSLEADMGPGIFVQDFADWAEARLIRDR